MWVLAKFRHIAAELKRHAPFTVAGAILGLVFMFLFRDVSKPAATAMFGVFHPAHVVLSALVTASLFRIHTLGRNFLMVLIVGVTGSIGVATLSDSVIPFYGESILGVPIPTHAELHSETGTVEHAHQEHQHDIHIGFIEEWYVVFPAAILGVVIAYLVPRTRCPHAAHILISTWASAAHILMNLRADLTWLIGVGIFVVLFLAVWLPCCISDIVFPLLFVSSDIDLNDVCFCHHDGAHGNPHTHPHQQPAGEDSHG
jgi:hypothetical protein